MDALYTPDSSHHNQAEEEGCFLIDSCTAVLVIVAVDFCSKVELWTCYNFVSLCFRGGHDQQDALAMREGMIIEYVSVNVTAGYWLPFIRYLQYCRLETEYVEAYVFSRADLGSGKIHW